MLTAAWSCSLEQVLKIISIIHRGEVTDLATVVERVTKVIVDRLGVDESEVKIEASFRDDLGADSLDVVELVMELEDEFDMEISDDDAEKIGNSR